MPIAARRSDSPANAATRRNCVDLEAVCASTVSLNGRTAETGNSGSASEKYAGSMAPELKHPVESEQQFPEASKMSRHGLEAACKEGTPAARRLVQDREIERR